MSDTDDQSTKGHKIVPLMWGDGEDRVEIGEVEVTEGADGMTLITTDLNATGEKIFDNVIHGRDEMYSVEPQYEKVDEVRRFGYPPGTLKIQKELEDLEIPRSFQQFRGKIPPKIDLSIDKSGEEETNNGE